MPTRFTNLADAADYLNSAPGFMKSFGDFGSKARPWFYSFNSKLAGSAARPKQFANWEHWHHFKMNQKEYLCTQAGLKSNAIVENRAMFDRLHEQWESWPAAYHVVNWATTTAHGSTCNIFLGECLTLCGYENEAQHAGKYLSAQSYWMNHNRGFVQQVDKRAGSIKRGMIMSYHYDTAYHLEVVTSGAVGEETWFGLSEADEKTTFRSRGGGRGEGGDGVEKQGGVARTLSNTRLKVFKLSH